MLASVQGSRPQPYRVRVGLAAFDDETWRQVETALAGQAIFSARLLAGEMPAEIEEVFAAAGQPLFPTSVAELAMRCSCPDPAVPCKHIAATFYLLAEAFDDDPFQILHWRGRDREQLLARLRKLRGGRRRRGDVAVRPRLGGSGPRRPPQRQRAAVGAAGTLSGLKSPDLAEVVDRFWVVPVPLPRQPSTLDIGSDLLLRQLPAPGAALGGAALVERLRPWYERFGTAQRGTDEAVRSYVGPTSVPQHGPSRPDHAMLRCPLAT